VSAYTLEGRIDFVLALRFLSGPARIWRIWDACRARRRQRHKLSYVCRLVRLTLLAPEIVERILRGRTTAGLARILKPFSVEWERQREQFC
jgi:hypothetical protein